MKKNYFSLFLVLAGFIALFLVPDLASAASTIDDVGNAQTIGDVITAFANIPLVKGTVMVGAILGGAYLVLKGFGIIGGENASTNIKLIVLGFIATGIGLGYDSIVGYIAKQFS